MRKIIVILLSGIMLFSVNVFAETAETETGKHMESSYCSTIVPYYMGIVSANNNLNITASDFAECSAKHKQIQAMMQR